jgi:hypothetical protein
MAEDTPTGKAPIAFSDSIGIGAFVFAMIAFAFLPTWWLRLPMLITAITGLVFLIYRSLWTHAWNPLTKVLAAIVSSTCLLAVGISQIVDQLKAENRWQPFVIALSSLDHGLARVIASPWTIRCVCVLVGMVLVLLYQWARRTLSSSIAKRASGQDKGLLDYKMQTEQSMNRLRPVTDAITQIVLDSTASVNLHAEKRRVAAPSSTGMMMKFLGQSAKAMDKYSEMLSARGRELEQIGNLFAEGVSGWLFWLRKNSNTDTSSQEFLLKLHIYAKALENNLKAYDDYLEVLETGRGISQTMNTAIDARVKSVKQIREANENIWRACTAGLEAFDVPADV